MIYFKDKTSLSSRGKNIILKCLKINKNKTIYKIIQDLIFKNL